MLPIQLKKMPSEELDIAITEVEQADREAIQDEEEEATPITEAIHLLGTKT